MSLHTRNPKVDAYISNAKPFAVPILQHLRALIHGACPQVEETIKWSRPFFEYKGAILCNISGFKEHCTMGFWGEEIAAVLREANALQSAGMGSLGRITSLKDLPSDQQMLRWIKQGAAFIDAGTYTSPVTARQKVAKAPRAVPEAPPEFLTAIQANSAASEVYKAFSPSCKREYIEWIADAKRVETRNRRIATAVEWIAKGQQRNWKYQNC